MAGSRNILPLGMVPLAVALTVLAGLPAAETGQPGEGASAEQLYRSAQAGMALWRQGKLTEAIPHYEEAVRLAPRVHGATSLDTAVLHNHLGLLYYHTGQLAQAAGQLERCLAIREERLPADHLDVAEACNNLAVQLKEMGQFERAEPLYRRSLAIREAKQPGSLELAGTQDNLGFLYQYMGQYDRADPLFRQSLEIRKARLGEGHPTTAQSYRNLGLQLAARGRLDDAEPLFQRSLAIWEEHPELGPGHRKVAISLTSLGAIHAQRGDYTQAGQAFRRALAIMEAKGIPDDPEVARSLSNLALLHARQGRWEEAAGRMDRARRIYRSYALRALSALSETDQLVFLRTNEQPALYQALSMGLAGRDRPEVAALSAGWLLNGKALALETLAEQTLLLRQRRDPVLAGDIEQLRDARARLARLSVMSPPPGREQELVREIERLRQREADLSRSLAQALGQARPDRDWVELDRVRGALPRDAVLVEIGHFRQVAPGSEDRSGRGAPARYAAWVIPPPPGQVTVVDLGEADAIDRAVAAFRLAMAAAQGTPRQPGTIRAVGEPEAERILRQPLMHLSRLVLHPLLPHLEGRPRWVVSPDGSLWLVPWAALLLPDGHYAVEGHVLRQAVSGRELVRPAPRAGPLGPPLLFANPDFDLDPGQVASETRRVAGTPDRPPAPHRGPGRLPGSATFPPLLATEAEARGIAPSVRLLCGTEPRLLTGAQALEGVLKRAQRPRLLVLSTHGFFLEGTAGALDNPLLQCGLALAGANRRQEARPPDTDDGVLTGLEIVGTNLTGTELVVLSACETGLGQVRAGEGVAGLRQAFQLAGARAVMASLWKVPDRETAQLMVRFFGELGSVRHGDEALRNAQLALMTKRRDANGAAHPMYWSAFTLTGP